MLDIHTPTGQKFAAREQEVLQRLRDIWKLDVIGTAEPTVFDAIVAKNKIAVAVVEIRTRNNTYAQLREFGSYLVTEKKLLECKQLTNVMNVLFMLVVQTSDNHIFYFKIAKDGKYLLPVSTKNTVTQANCNGGQKTGENAFLDYQYANDL